MLYRHKFFKIILTHLAKHDILCHKSHWFCGLVWNHPQDVVVFILNTASPWIIPERFTAPQHTRFILPPIHPTKSFACTAWAVFFFFTNKILCSCTNLRKSFLVVDCTTSKCYSYVWKKQDVVSALCLAFFILNLESFISRLNVISCHDLTLSVGEPENAAAKQGQELRSEQTVIPITWAGAPLLIFCALIIRKHL